MVTGSQKTSIKEIMNMIKEILGKNIKIKFIGERLESHYELTPYTYKPILSNKINLEEEVDLGEGILELINHISNKR